MTTRPVQELNEFGNSATVLNYLQMVRLREALLKVTNAAEPAAAGQEFNLELLNEINMVLGNHRLPEALECVNHETIEP